MSGRLAVDFGTSNTVLAAWDSSRRQSDLLALPDYGRALGWGETATALVPSLIHYPSDEAQWIGQQVRGRNLVHHPSTFRWLKRYLMHRSPVRRKVHNRQLSVWDAAADFLGALLLTAVNELGQGNDEVAFTVPVESFEHYENWLGEVAEGAGLPRLRLIDEASAAALGYGVPLQAGDVYLVFDFGGGTLDVSVVRVEEAGESSRRCRVLGKAGEELGGLTLDQWIFEAVLSAHCLTARDPLIKSVGAALLVECESLKEKLSSQPQAELSVVDPSTGRALGFELSVAGFEALIDERDGFATIDRTVRRALNESRERGYDEQQIKSVFMVGGSSQIPAVGTAVRRIFGKERVFLDRPLEAVARGGAAFVGGVDFFDHIQHDYAIRWVDPGSGAPHYQVLVKRGTPYPTEGPVARMVVKATYDGQTQLGLAIFELGANRARKQMTELVFDAGGAARLRLVGAGEIEDRVRFWMNEHTPTFLPADPPARAGERCYQVMFSVDARKRLVVTALDLVHDVYALEDFPVVKLS